MSTECCQAAGMTQLCQQLCSFSVDLEEAVRDLNYITCLSHFDTLIRCAAGNHFTLGGGGGWNGGIIQGCHSSAKIFLG